MGIDLNRLVEELDEEFVCKLCKRLPEDVVHIANCEHMFCKQCLDNHLTEQLIHSNVNCCPIDGRKLAKRRKYCPPPRIVRNILDDVLFRCLNHANGCQQLLTIKSVDEHNQICEYSASDGRQQYERRMETDNGSNVVTHQNSFEDLIKVIKELKDKVDVQALEIAEIRSRIMDNRIVFLP